MTNTSRVGLAAIVVAVAAIGAPSLAAAAALPHRAPVLAQSANGCYMSVSPTSGPVGTLVSIEGSTAGCASNAGGGALGFADEYAGVPVPNVNDLLPQHGSFAYSFRIPAVMPSGNWYAAAEQYPGPALCPGRVLLAVFPSVGRLPSTTSAAGEPASFGSFAGTTRPSDFPRSFISGVRPWPSLSGPPRDQRGGRDVGPPGSRARRFRACPGSRTARGPPAARV